MGRLRWVEFIQDVRMFVCILHVLTMIFHETSMQFMEFSIVSIVLHSYENIHDAFMAYFTFIFIHGVCLYSHQNDVP